MRRTARGIGMDTSATGRPARVDQLGTTDSEPANSTDYLDYLGDMILE